MINNIPTTISNVQGDSGYTWYFTLQDSQGNPVVITGATLEFKGQLVSDTTVQFSTGMSIQGASVCSYTIGASDFPVVGTYNCSVVITYVSGEQITFEGITVICNPAVPQ
jgi:hypothetical protein